MNYRSIVVLTGAGVSAESGIRTFRGGDGLWENHRIEDVATPEAFVRDPQLVDLFYNERRKQLLDPQIKPNSAHEALVKFEEFCVKSGCDFFLVTQNVDNLHERAGSKNLLHMHGELLKIRHGRTEEVKFCDHDITRSTHKEWRPHIVWFGEMPIGLDETYTALEKCDLFIAIGTSGQVYPAAGFAAHARQAHRIEVNLEGTPASGLFHEHRRGLASQEVPRLFQEIMLANKE
jgi:NAD-dependent deacetylase